MGNDSGSHGQRVGYIRVSTVEQNNQRQKELLNASGRIDPVSYTHLTLPTIYSV